MLSQSNQGSTTYGNGTNNISFTTVYAKLPIVTANARVRVDNGASTIAISDVTVGGFEFKLENRVGGVVEVWWRAVGAAAL